MGFRYFLSTVVGFWFLFLINHPAISLQCYVAFAHLLKKHQASLSTIKLQFVDLIELLTEKKAASDDDLLLTPPLPLSHACAIYGDPQLLRMLHRAGALTDASFITKPGVRMGIAAAACYEFCDANLRTLLQLLGAKILVSSYHEENLLRWAYTYVPTPFSPRFLTVSKKKKKKSRVYFFLSHVSSLCVSSSLSYLCLVFSIENSG